MHDDESLDDDALRARLRAADPADALAPLPPTWLDHRMEQLMTETPTTPAVHRGRHHPTAPPHPPLDRP